MTAGLPMNAGFQPGDCMKLKFRDSKCLNQAWIPAFAGMTASLKATRLAEMTSFPRKRESISVSESRNLSMEDPLLRLIAEIVRPRVTD